MNQSVKSRRWLVVVAAVTGVFVVSLISSFLSLAFLSGTVLGESIRERFGLTDLKTLNIQTNRTERVVVEESSAIIEASKKVGQSVVSITSGRLVQGFFGLRTEQAAGTGFVLTSDGLIATNKHVVEGAERFTVTTFDGRDYEGTIAAKDPVTDLALIRIEARGLSPVELGDSDAVQVGQWVIAIGNSLGEFQNSVTVGVVSAKDRQVVAQGQGAQVAQLDGLIQTDAAINSGNSGGPLLTLTGQVIGINTAIAGGDAQNVGFAIPSNELRKALESYKTNDKIIRPFLGVRYQTITSVIARELNLATDQGALLVGRGDGGAIVAGSPAEKVGLREGDIIVRINNDRVTERTPLAQLIRKYDAGQTVRIAFLRNGAEQTVELTLGRLGD